MSIDALISRLEKPRQTGAGRWSAKCPAHEDRSPSLSVRELEDGRILVHCFTGCPAADILAAVGLEFADLYPERPEDHAKPERRPFPAADVLRALYHEILVVAAAGQFLAEGRALTQADRARLALAAQRIQNGVSLSGVNRHG